jgi:hypothetical protein
MGSVFVDDGLATVQPEDLACFKLVWRHAQAAAALDQ